MNSKLWIQKALTTCSLMALIASYSMVALASAPANSGELIVSGSAGETSFVTVNGEPAKSGRTVFSSSTISTPDGMNATLNLGKAGKVAFGPNTTFSVNFDESAITGTLTSGNLTVLGAAQPVEVKTLDRGLVRVNAGETVSATATALRDDTRDSTGKCIDSDNDGKLECDEGGNWLVWGLVVAGAIAGLIFIATADNDADIGSGAGTVSPTR
jgi:hypothetical protein